MIRRALVSTVPNQRSRLMTTALVVHCGGHVGLGELRPGMLVVVTRERYSVYHRPDSRGQNYALHTAFCFRSSSCRQHTRALHSFLRALPATQKVTEVHNHDVQSTSTWIHKSSPQAWAPALLTQTKNV
ncbi:hypothetical protein BDW69DRAFT_106048 [Aspergillus filifer]